jgi:hypothetical protein
LVLLLACGSGGRSSAPDPRSAPSSAGRATTGAAGPVEGQLAAYNAHELERFLRFYAEDVRLHDVGPDSTAVTRGKQAMREGYAFLAWVPAGFRADIVSRLVAGRYVVDHERVVAPGEPAQEALVIYEVADTLITRVWFLPNP